MMEQSTDNGSDTGPSKTCINCRQRKPVAEFRRDGRTTDGFKLCCLACERELIPASQERQARAPVTTASNQKPLWSEDKRREMLMILVYGFNEQAEVLEQCYGKSTPAFEAAMARVREAFETLFDLLPNGEDSGRVTGAAAAVPTPETPGSP